jgi:hypothetical protein
MSLPIVRTAKGTVTDKTGALTLTISNLQLNPTNYGAMLLVGIAFDDAGSAEAPVIKWGTYRLERVYFRTGNGLTVIFYAFMRQKRTSATNDLVATWTTAPTAKALFATEITGVGEQEIETRGGGASTDAPTAGAEVTSVEPVQIFIGAMASEGPQNDPAGTPGDGYTAGQRAGTGGLPPASNITIQEIFKIVSATEATQASLSGVTARSWSCVLASFLQSTDIRQGITPTDLNTMRDLFNDRSPDPLPFVDHVFHYNAKTGRWLIYHVDDLDNTGTQVAHRTKEGNWIED